MEHPRDSAADWALLVYVPHSFWFPILITIVFFMVLPRWFFFFLAGVGSRLSVRINGSEGEKSSALRVPSTARRILIQNASAPLSGAVIRANPLLPRYALSLSLSVPPLIASFVCCVRMYVCACIGTVSCPRLEKLF